MKSLSRVWLLATPWTAPYQAPPSMGFSRQEYWSGVPLPSPESCFKSEYFCHQFVYLFSTLLFYFCFYPWWLVITSEQWRKNMWLYNSGRDQAIPLSIFGIALSLSNLPNLYNYTASAGQGFFLIQHQWTVWVWMLAQAQRISSTQWFPWRCAIIKISKHQEAETCFHCYSKMEKIHLKESLI